MFSRPNKEVRIVVLYVRSITRASISFSKLTAMPHRLHHSNHFNIFYPQVFYIQTTPQQKQPNGSGTLAEWLRRWPAKPVRNAFESSNLSGVEIRFFSFFFKRCIIWFFFVGQNGANLLARLFGRTFTGPGGGF